jgi:hypothetical protein
MVQRYTHYANIRLLLVVGMLIIMLEVRSDLYLKNFGMNFDPHLNDKSLSTDKTWIKKKLCII